MNSLRIGWSALIVVSSVTLLIGFADAQLSRQEQANINLMAKTPLFPSKLDGWIPPGQRTMEMVALTAPAAGIQTDRPAAGRDPRPRHGRQSR